MKWEPPLKPLIILCFIKKEEWEVIELRDFINNKIFKKYGIKMVRYHNLLKHLNELSKDVKKGLPKQLKRLKTPLLIKEGRIYKRNFSVENINDYYKILQSLILRTRLRKFETLYEIFAKLENILKLINSELLKDEKIKDFLYFNKLSAKEKSALISGFIEDMLEILQEVEKLREELHFLGRTPYKFLIRPVSVKEGIQLIESKLEDLEKEVKRTFESWKGFAKTAHERKLLNNLENATYFELSLKKIELIHLLRHINEKYKQYFK